MPWAPTRRPCVPDCDAFRQNACDAVVLERKAAQGRDPSVAVRQSSVSGNVTEGVELRCGAAALARACLFPALSSGGALVGLPGLAVHGEHQATLVGLRRVHRAGMTIDVLACTAGAVMIEARRASRWASPGMSSVVTVFVGAYTSDRPCLLTVALSRPLAEARVIFIHLSASAPQPLGG